MIDTKIIFFQKACPDWHLGENVEYKSSPDCLVQNLERLFNQEKVSIDFFKKLTITSSLGCRQVIWSIRLARLSFLETNSLIGFPPLTPCYIQSFQ